MTWWLSKGRDFDLGVRTPPSLNPNTVSIWKCVLGQALFGAFSAFLNKTDSTGDQVWCVLAGSPFKHLSAPISSVLHTPGPPVQMTFGTCLRIHSECHWPGVWLVLGAQGWNRKGISANDFPFVNQMCLGDEEPIHGMCKLFGDHKSHQVAEISDAYAERKVSFT